MIWKQHAPGSAEQRLAIERGELDGDCGSFASIPAQWLQSGNVNLFVRFTRDKEAGMPDSARFVEDFAKTQEDKELEALLEEVLDSMP